MRKKMSDRVDRIYFKGFEHVLRVTEERLTRNVSESVVEDGAARSEPYRTLYVGVTKRAMRGWGAG